jgi:hypothetical protein
MLFALCPLWVSAEERTLVEVTWPDLFVRQAAVDAGYDFFEGDFQRALIYALPSELAWLEENGAEPRVAQEALDAMEPRGTPTYFTLAEYEAAMTQWASAHPSIVSLFSLGQSLEGREIYMLRLSDNAATDENEPEVLLLSLQHAREWLSGMTLNGVTDYFVTQYGTDAEVTELIDNMEIYVILVANPDGYLYTHTNDRFWRKNRRDNGNGTFGVDLNRNWPVEWVASSNTSSNLYGGTAPLSEPETVALDNWLKAPERNLMGVVNYHTYNTRIMHNWAFTYELPPNEHLMGRVADQFGHAMTAVNGQRFRTGSWAITLNYIGGGATVDYVGAELGVPALTLELRPGDGTSGGFAPSANEIPPSVTENIDGAKYFLQWALDQHDESTTPTISDLSISLISDTTATFSWETDVPAYRSVSYSNDGSTTNTARPDRLLGTIHEVTLEGLVANTTYHYEVTAESITGDAASISGTFSTTATPQDVEAPGYPAILSLRHGEPGKMLLRYNTLFPADVVGSRLYASDNLNTWTLLIGEDVLNTDAIVYTVDLPSTISVHAFRMVNVDDAGLESIPSDAYAYAPLTAPDEPRVLIVDGFDVWNSRPIAQEENHPFSAWHGFDLAAAEYSFESCANQQVGTEINLTDYRAVIWVLGDEGEASTAFSASERNAVRAFLEAGGSLFVSGSDAAANLDGQDAAFLSEYLGATFVAGDADYYDVTAIGESFYQGDPFYFDYGDQNVYRVGSPDRINAASGATACLETDFGLVLGVQLKGLFGSGALPGAVIFLSFPFETIGPISARRQVMSDAMTYFDIRSPKTDDGLLVY